MRSVIDSLRRQSFSAKSPAVPLVLANADPRMLDVLSPEYALRNALLPIRRAGAVTVLASADPNSLNRERAKLESKLGPVSAVEANLETVQRAIQVARNPQLAQRAKKRTDAQDSCRTWGGKRSQLTFATFACLICLSALLWPTHLLVVFAVWATVSLVAVTGLRTVGALSQLVWLRKNSKYWRSQRIKSKSDQPLPTISVLVPLFKEKEIASRLIQRLMRLDYPESKLEVLLILEESDRQTRNLVENTKLAAWMRPIVVPGGGPQTKPRALNYALDFSRGEIVGIYDAEDAPAPDQLRKVASAFQHAPPQVACIQGILDFYNARQSWLTRCFTIDYACWFRLILPGLVRLGFAIPLGGTTVFIRREVLEKVGRWDAHNVTEDADLGIRLARRGYRTEFVRSVTLEEATASTPTWINQRSRWIKGYAMTWSVHMRRPIELFKDLGLKRFLGFQILFLGSLTQFLLAPILWSFWLILFGFDHFVTDVIAWPIVVTIGALFLLSEIATVFVAAISVATPRHRGLIWWVPLLHLYFPLSTIACWKGLSEMFTRPFYWQKTSHGHYLIRQDKSISGSFRISLKSRFIST